MAPRVVHLGSTPVVERNARIAGETVRLGSVRYHRIGDYDRMPPFFLSIVSDSDHWMFISSTGGLSAGRRSASQALFPYYTEDRIHDDADHTGARTVIRLERSGKVYLWEPFSLRRPGPYRITRNLLKSFEGNRLLFEEINHDLEAVFRHEWMSSDRFGFVRRSELENLAAAPVSLEVLDGIENILPWGVTEYFQNHYSCLGDAYKQNELERETGLGTFAFSSLPGDSPEPAEALRATVCWSTCSPDRTRLLSSTQLDGFRSGHEIRSETRVCGRRGSYLVHEKLSLLAGETRDWHIVADVDCGPVEIARLRKTLREGLASGGASLKTELEADIERGTRGLTRIVAQADGLQTTGDALGSAHHFSNVLFNVMRGGIFESGYRLPVADLASFIESFSPAVFARHRGLLDTLGETIALDELLARARASGDVDLVRITHEYLPLSFSRRHGDPSRPWNRFAIDVKRRDGSRVLNYQGNWRDIFQNWEALSVSFPGYLESIIAKFVNTTTADGHNPYRVTRDGYEWEAPEPDAPWASFGYWGDHQLVYLLRLLEMSRRHHPGKLRDLLADRVFVHAEVPYDLKPYREILSDPKRSIAYSTRREEAIAARVATRGQDGKYTLERSGDLARANLTEKLLVPLLAKMSSFIPGGGFWMNTQRPEWNDANNALAGYGVSMVTVYHARRYVSFCLELLEETPHESSMLNAEVAEWLREIAAGLERHRDLLGKERLEDADRRALLDSLGEAGERYRLGIYAAGFRGEEVAVAKDELVAFLGRTREYLDHTIGLSRRADGLYHAYRVLEVTPAGISVADLVEMLEGQVAVLSSGLLDSREALSVLRSLRTSAMYRADQHSYLLYPDRELPGFLEKNTIPPDRAAGSRLLSRLVADGNTDLVERDIDGRWHFNSFFKNIRDVRAALERLRSAGLAELVDAEASLVEELFESVFHHREFTGRSMTFYGYEGLGSIYWHMVSKLLLATQECCLRAHAANEDAFEELAERYYEVRAGIGFNKTPEVYGAFPTDPYSHTPGHGGAKQPGMTGQVKEEVLTRLGELGLVVDGGAIRFHPVLLRRSEFLTAPERFHYIDVEGSSRTLDLEAGSLAFTSCQVPIVYVPSGRANPGRPAATGAGGQVDETRVQVHLADGSTREIAGGVLDPETSQEIFQRTGKVVRLTVHLEPGLA